MDVFHAPRKAILVPAALAFTLAYPFLHTFLPRSSTLPVTSESPPIYVKQAFIYTDPASGDDPSSILHLIGSAADNLPASTLLNAASQPHRDDKTRTGNVTVISASDRPPSDLDIPCLIVNEDYSITLYEQDFDSFWKQSDLSYSPDLEFPISKHSSSMLLAYVYQNQSHGKIWDDIFISHIDNDSPPSRRPSGSGSSSWLADLISSHWLSAQYILATMIVYTSIPYGLIAIFMLVLFSSIPVIRSKSGLLLAYLVQTVLSFSAAASVVHFTYPSVTSLRWDHASLIFLTIMSHSIQNVFRLLHALGQFPIETSPLNKVVGAAKDAWQISARKVSVDAFLVSLVFLPGLHCGESLRAVSLFMLLTIVIDYILHITYFTAVVSLDLRRYELEDLILSDLDDADYNHPADLGSQKEYSSFAAKSKLKLRIESFVYFRYLYFRKHVPSISTLGIIFYLWLTMQSDPASSTVYKRSQAIPFIMEFSEKLHASTKENRYSNYKSVLNLAMLTYEATIEIFHPILVTLSKDRSGFSTHVPYRVKDSFFFSKIESGITLNAIIEFVSCISFILSLSGIVMSLVLPERATHAEDPKLIANEARYSFKDLVGCHTLDVLRIVANGKWFATMSLDRKICVWKPVANSNRVSDIFEVPVPPEFWPVGKIVLNGHNHMVAVFSPGTSTIKCWNFGKSYLNYYYTHPSLNSNNNVVGSFFCGKDLVVITGDGIMMIINDKGEANILLIFEKCHPLRTIDENSSSAKNEEGNIRIISVTKLVTPLLHEQVVILGENNEVFVAVHVGKNWRFRHLQLFESLSAVRSLKDGSSDNFSFPTSLRDYRLGKFQPYINRQMQFSERYKVIVPLPQLNMVLLASDTRASILDVFSGTVLRHFQLGHYIKGSLHVFHSKPTHCRFCGCSSIESLSVAYMDAENAGTVIVHSLQIENRSKNTICLRVERDPREIRCLGFEAATEHHHWITKVEGWDTTDMNMIMGVRRREKEESLGEARPSCIETQLGEWINTFLSATLKVIAVDFGSAHTEEYPKVSAKPPLNSTWEGWAMSASGKITYYDIPDVVSTNGPPGSSDRLLIKKIGPVTKYGHKSIAVAFGNIIKVLYFGREEDQNEFEESDGNSLLSGSFTGGRTRKRRGPAAHPNGASNFTNILDH